MVRNIGYVRIFSGWGELSGKRCFVVRMVKNIKYVRMVRNIKYVRMVRNIR